VKTKIKPIKREMGFMGFMGFQKRGPSVFRLKKAKYGGASLSLK
jgi:hypothetical protein